MEDETEQDSTNENANKNAWTYQPTETTNKHQSIKDSKKQPQGYKPNRYCVGEAQEEILTLGYLISQLILRSSWVGKEAHARLLTSALQSIVRLISALLIPIAPAMYSKIRINIQKYPAKQCKESNAIQHYSSYSSQTGVYKDSDTPLFPDIDDIAYVPKHARTYINNTMNPINEHELHYGNLCDFDKHVKQWMKEIKRFAKTRNWLHKYTEPAVYLSLFSELGELSSTIQWLIPYTPLRLLSPTKRDTMARELCDITIYLLHFCRIKKVRPTLCKDRDINDIYGSYSRYVFPFKYGIQFEMPILAEQEDGTILM
jgi:hypothetical protein